LLHVKFTNIAVPFALRPRHLAHIDMAKRKRYSDDNATDVGLGATLALLREEEHAVSNRTSAGEPDDDDGWTTVGAPKKKRRQQQERYGSVTSPVAPSNGKGHYRKADDADSPDGPEELNDVDGAVGRVTVPANPFSTKDKDDSERMHQPAGHSSPQRGASESEERKQARVERRKERKLERNYPAIEHSHHARLQSQVKVSDLQSLILYLLADGTAPQWVSVRSRNSIRNVVVLMVPGLELAMFNGDVPLEAAEPTEVSNKGEPSEDVEPSSNTNNTTSRPKRLHVSPDEFYPASLKPHRLPDALKPLADIFSHVWPVKGIGEHRANQYYRIHSPIHTMLTSQIPKSQEEKQMRKNHKGPMPQNTKHWENKRTPITEYIATLVEQQENEYVVHPAWFATPEAKDAAYQRRKAMQQAADDGWVDTNIASIQDGDVPEKDIEQGSVTVGRKILTVDCEMCKSEEDKLVLTRVSLLDWDGNVVLDKLVKPDVPIKDYLTQYACHANSVQTFADQITGGPALHQPCYKMSQQRSRTSRRSYWT
jgi:RNA exonuclease 1